MVIVDYIGVCVGGGGRGCVNTSTWWPWAMFVTVNVDSTGLIGLNSLQICPFVAFFEQRNHRYM